MGKAVAVIGYFFLLTFLLFSPFFLERKIPFPGDYLLAWHEPWHSVYSQNDVPTIAHKPVVDDAIRHLYPLRVLAWESIKQGQLPLWNPLNGAGTPLLALMHQGYLNPFGIVFLFFSAPIAWTLYLMFQIPLLGLATYWYCRTIRLSRLACLFSSTILLLSGFVIARIEYSEFLYILATLPLLLGFIEKRWFILIPAAVAFMFFAGQPHMIIYVLGSSALYAPARKKLLVFLLSTFLGSGLAAIQLVPTFELFGNSTITQKSSEFIFQTFLLPLRHLVTILIPNFFGSQATYNFFGPGSDYVETIAYVGLIPVFFAVFTKRISFFSVLAVISIAATLDWFGTRFLYSLPIPVLSSDVPSRIFVLSTFAIAILAGLGFDAWIKNRISRKFIFTFLACVALIAYFSRIPCPDVIPQCKFVSLRNFLLEIAVFGVATIAILRGWRLMLLAVVLMIGLYNGQKFLPFADQNRIYPSLPVIEKLQELTDSNRVFTVGNAHIRTNILSQFKISTPEYFDPLHVRRFAELVSFANAGGVDAPLLRSDIEIVRDATVSGELKARRERLFDLTSTRYLLYKNNEVPPQAPVVWSDSTWTIVENKSSLPREYSVSKFSVLESDDQILSKLFDPIFEPRNEVILEEPITEPLTRGPLDNALTEPPVRFLVLTDAFYPGWKAFVDGKETKIYRANFAFRAVAVPAGKHTVSFTYDPESLRLGLLISMISGALYIVIMVKYRSDIGAVAKR